MSGAARTRLPLGVATLVAAALVVLTPATAEACPVCFGATDSPMAHGVNNGILTLLGVVIAVQIGFVAMFVSIRRRSKRYQERKESFTVIDGGALGAHQTRRQEH